MSDFLFINAPGASVASGTQRVRTRGHSVNGRGSADYVYDPAVTANGPTTFVAADGRGFRLAPDQRITIDMFGAKPDDHGLYGTPGATDNYPAFQAAFDWLEANQVEPLAGFAALPELAVPIGFYYCGTQLELKEGAFALVGSRGSRIRFPANSNGIIIHSQYTIGETTNGDIDSGANSLIRSLAIRGGGGTNENKHGVRCRAIFQLDEVTISEFPGDGLHIVADVTASEGTAVRGNANQFTARTVNVIHNGRHGAYLKGGDANAGCAIQINALDNGRWGVFDDSFLGNTHMGHHVDSNGIQGAGTSSNPNQSSSIVAHNGKRYSVRIGQEAAASTTVPGTNEGVWIQTAVDGVGPGVPAWASGTAYFSGGAYASTSPSARNVFVGCYSEGSQGISQFAPQTLVVGGLQGAGVRGGAMIEAANGAVHSNIYTAGDRENAFAVLGGGEGVRKVMSLVDNVHNQLGYDLRFHAGTGDLVCHYANLDGVTPFRVTGPTSNSPVGANRFLAPAIGVGWGGDARLIAMGGGAPTEGYWPQGTRVFYSNPVAGGKEGVVCVASGTPGTWKEFGSIQAYVRRPAPQRKPRRRPAPRPPGAGAMVKPGSGRVSGPS